MSSLDLRMSHHHTIGVFEDSASTGWIHQMKHRSNYILSENMNGKIKLWDIRSFKCIEEFYGHRNSRHRLPCFVDPTERFLFAGMITSNYSIFYLFFSVDEDGVSRGWSLTSTELLCTIPCPRAVESRADFPRIIFSENWGGIGGNSAIILAVDNELRIHELLL
jgi:DDB1- and CUL4-associated factor 4